MPLALPQVVTPFLRNLRCKGRVLLRVKRVPLAKGVKLLSVYAFNIYTIIAIG
jgi:hypothetical protein